MNKALSPPLSGDELRKIWDDAQAQEGATAADRRAREPGPEREAPGSLGLQKVTSGETRPAAPPTITAAELTAKVLVPPDFIIEGILPAGLTILAGKPKVGKSWFALGASVAVSCGGHILGAWRYKVKAGAVLHLGLEDTEGRMKTRLAKLMQGRPHPPDLRLITSQSRPRMPRLNYGGLEALREKIEALTPRLVVIDTFAKIRPHERGNRNLCDVDCEHVGDLKELADEFGIAILVLHHPKKGA
jgi:RecA-family ATPase